MSSLDWPGKARSICLAALAEPDLASISRQLANWSEPAAAYAALNRVTASADSVDFLLSRAREIAAEPRIFGRCLLLLAALHAIPELSAYPVYQGVKEVFAEDLLSWAQPSASADFSPESARFREMARVVTLRRFPAGQFHWELSGMPRSHVPHTEWPKWPRLLFTLALETRGFSPMAETHLNDRRKNRLTLSESEAAKSYFLVAKSLELQPHIKGLFTESWLYCESTGRVSPRLAWMREFLLKRGALLASTRLAPVDSGFLRGSNERRELYEKGLYRPRMTYVLWPRGAMIKWAARYQNDMQGTRL